MARNLGHQWEVLRLDLPFTEVKFVHAIVWQEMRTWHLIAQGHTTLLSREKEKKKKKKQEETFVHLCLLFSYLIQPDRENRHLKVLRNTVGLNSYLGRFALRIFFLFGLHIKIEMGGNSFAKRQSVNIWDWSKQVSGIINPFLRKVFKSQDSFLPCP